jgi:hypothetical protein
MDIKNGNFVILEKYPHETRSHPAQRVKNVVPSSCSALKKTGNK